MASVSTRASSPLGWMLRAAAVSLPLSLLWDYSWESTVGIDYPWAAPHLAGCLAALAMAAVAFALRGSDGLRLGFWKAPLWAWAIWWGALAFATAVLFEIWWQASYGLGAGIWHPPQLLKAVAFFVLLAGGWWRAPVSSWAGGALLAMIGVVTLALNFANRQHSAAFYQVACAAYPLVLVAQSVAAPTRFGATCAALAYMALGAAAVWMLPLVPGQPLASPIFHPRDHLLPPPFPLLLVVPALGVDFMLRIFPGPEGKRAGWGAAVETGLAFGLLFLAAQWLFAFFLLSPAADNRFFAGGGRHWPFFLQIQPGWETAFWHSTAEALTLPRMLAALGLAVISAGLGLLIGTWMKGLRR